VAAIGARAAASEDPSQHIQRDGTSRQATLCSSHEAPPGRPAVGLLPSGAMSSSTGLVWRENRVARDGDGEGGLVPQNRCRAARRRNPSSLPSGRGRPPCVRPLDYHVRRSSGSSPWAAIAATCASRSSTKIVTTEFVADPYDVGMESTGRARSWDKVVFRGDPVTGSQTLPPSGGGVGGQPTSGTQSVHKPP
jgi:hypothetical protein